jgi:hypothetical protein
MIDVIIINFNRAHYLPELLGTIDYSICNVFIANEGKDPCPDFPNVTVVNTHDIGTRNELGWRTMATAMHHMVPMCKTGRFIITESEILPDPNVWPLMDRFVADGLMCVPKSGVYWYDQDRILPLHVELYFLMGLTVADWNRSGGISKEMIGIAYEDQDFAKRMLHMGAKYKYLDAAAIHRYHNRHKTTMNPELWDKWYNYNKDLYYKRWKNLDLTDPER